jgi:hypothetical protein
MSPIILLSLRRFAICGASAVALLLIPVFARAQAATPLGNASGKEYVLARRSSFDAPAASSRNPFWPIGWVPSTTVSHVETAVIDVQADAFRVTATSVDYPPLAVINGRTYGVGEQVPVAAHPGAFVTVRQILDGVVVLDYHGHELRATNGPAVHGGAPTAH